MSRSTFLCGALCLALTLTLASAPPTAAQQAPPAGPFGAPPAAQEQNAAQAFAGSQLADIGATGRTATAPSLTVRGYVDAGYIQITQQGPNASGGDLSWAFGNSQFTYSAPISTFAVNEVALTLDGSREEGELLLGARASINFYPSRDQQIYQSSGTDRPFQVSEAFLFAEFQRHWNTRVILGRAPGFVTLEQQDGYAPDSRLIGHSYVFQASGGYPYGLQVLTWPWKALAIKLGYANGGLGDYGFFQGDDSTTNRATAREEQRTSNPALVEGKTTYGALEYVAFDRAAEFGTLTLGVAGAANPALTYDGRQGRGKPYAFTNVYAAYRWGALEARAENAALRAFYEAGLGQFDATMVSVLLSYVASANHLFTLRGERIAFVSDRAPDVRGTATKNGLTYRLRISDPMVLKVEYVTEVQTPQFWQPALHQQLTTTVLATSWIYSF